MAGVISFTSCDVDLLEIPQQGVTNEEAFYKTDQDCEEAIAAVYRSWRTAFSGGHRGASQYANGFFVAIILLVGVGSVIHSMVDFAISYLVWQPLKKTFGVRTIQA